ncbi:MAG: hypothetical protein DDT41_01624 [candidate division WS2 bacterium]|nr:hypothetical protein [Candidatus Psychracetigena formicireducens]
MEAQKKFGRSERVSAWAAGNRTIFSYHLNLSTKILLHEMAHEIHNEYIRYRHSPIWWKEGIAMFSSLSESEIRGRVQQARFRVINNTHIPLMQLFSYPAEEYDLVYNVGLSVVVFLLNEYGASSFTAFNKAMREGKNFESALSSVYDIRNISKLNDKWEEALQDWKTWESMIKNLPKMLEE